MIVFDLRCGSGHVFEAWFGSTAAYEAQRGAGQVRCPMCDSAEVGKAVMAPNIAAKGRGVTIAKQPPSAAQMKAFVAGLAAAQAKALDGSTWVGKTFATRARAMHAGDEAERTIHGQATPAEVRSLVDDGVPVAPLPLPVTPPEQLN